MKQKLKNNKGITLIALVITIIVMLILVTVTIRVATNGNLFTHAANAVKGTKEAIRQENGILDGTFGEKSIEDWVEGLSANSIGETEGTINGITIKLSIAGKRVDNPPIPTGFSYKEGNIRDGYVITDGTNEFVWVPVDKNQKISLEVSSGEDIKSLKLYDPSGTVILSKNDDEIETEGTFTEIPPTTNGIYTATVITESDTAALKLFTVYSLYALTLNWLSPEVLTSIDPSFTSIEVVEAAFSSYGTNIDMVVSNNYSTYHITGYQETEDYNSYVAKNGGFYIGRFEAGKAATGFVCKQNAEPYNYISQIDAKALVEGKYSSNTFICDLPTGSAWDRTIGFLMEEGENSKTSSQVFADSTTWGNYKNASFTITNTSAKYSENNGTSYNQISTSYPKATSSSILLTTGASTDFKSKKIYDLAGNLWEWTTEPSGSNRVSRGGSYSHIGDNIPASIRLNDDPSSSISYIGFRPALFVK